MDSLEKEILSTVQSAMGKAISETMTAYNSPMRKMVDAVINSHEAEIKKIITESFETVIRTEDFKKSIVSAFSHKVARTIISNNDGMFDKVANEMKQDTIFKSKMTLAVATVVNEVLEQRKNKPE